MPFVPCKNCKKQILDTARFCGFCGADQVAPRFIAKCSTVIHIAKGKEDPLGYVFANLAPDLLLQHLNLYKDIFPSKLEEDARKIITTGKADDPANALNTLGEVAGLSDFYLRVIIAQLGTIDEKTLWIKEETKGIFDSTKVKTWAITNKRAYIYTHSLRQLYAIGLAVVEPLVTDVFRRSGPQTTDDIRDGRFVSVGAVGSLVPSIQGKGATFGSLAFLAQGVKVIELSFINDPQAVKELVDALKKQQKDMWQSARDAMWDDYNDRYNR